MSLDATTLLAPADRAPGHRGLRGRIAALVGLAGVVVLVLPRFTSTSGGSSGNGAWIFQFTVHSPSWSTSRVLLAAALLLCGGTALWLTRARPAVLVASVLSGVGVAVATFAIANPDRHERLSQLDFQSVPVGAPESQLVARFGSPISSDATATPAGGGAALRCFAYQGPANAQFPDVYLFCFEHGQLRVKAPG
jgi:hypothetical protein